MHARHAGPQFLSRSDCFSPDGRATPDFRVILTRPGVSLSNKKVWGRKTDRGILSHVPISSHKSPTRCGSHVMRGLRMQWEALDQRMNFWSIRGSRYRLHDVSRRMGALLLAGLTLLCGGCPAESGAVSGSPTREELGKLLAHSDPHLRAYAVYNVAYRFSEDAANLVNFITDPAPQVRRAAIFSLGLLEFESETNRFIQALKDDHYGVRRATVFALGNIRTARASAALSQAFRDKDSVVRQLAALAIARGEGKEHVSRLLPLLNDESPRVRRAAACALGTMGDPSAIEPLKKLYRDRKCSEPAEALARANAEVEKALKKKVNLDYKFIHFLETLDRLSEVSGVEIRVDDEVLFMLNTSATDPENLNSIRLAMWDVPFGAALRKVVETVGAYSYVEAGTINIASKRYEAYDTPVRLEAAAAMAFLGDRSGLSELRKLQDDLRFGRRARELLRAVSQP